jgi:hypothetical protein
MSPPRMSARPMRPPPTPSRARRRAIPSRSPTSACRRFRPTRSPATIRRRPRGGGSCSRRARSTRRPARGPSRWGPSTAPTAGPPPWPWSCTSASRCARPTSRASASPSAPSPPTRPSCCSKSAPARRVPFLSEMDANATDPRRAALIVRPLEPAALRHPLRPRDARERPHRRRRAAAPVPRLRGAARQHALHRSSHRGRAPAVRGGLRRARSGGRDAQRRAARPGVDHGEPTARARAHPRDARGGVRRAAMPSALPYTIDRVVDSPNNNVARIVFGTFTPPNYLNGDSCPGVWPRRQRDDAAEAPVVPVYDGHPRAGAYGHEPAAAHGVWPRGVWPRRGVPHGWHRHGAHPAPRAGARRGGHRHRLDRPVGRRPPAPHRAGGAQHQPRHPRDRPAAAVAGQQPHAHRAGRRRAGPRHAGAARDGRAHRPGAGVLLRREPRGHPGLVAVLGVAAHLAGRGVGAGGLVVQPPAALDGVRPHQDLHRRALPRPPLAGAVSRAPAGPLRSHRRGQPRPRWPSATRCPTRRRGAASSCRRPSATVRCPTSPRASSPTPSACGR